MQEFQVSDDPLQKPSRESENHLIPFHVRYIPAVITSIGVILMPFQKGDQCGLNTESLKKRFHFDSFLCLKFFVL